MTFLEAMDAVTLLGDGAVVRRASWVEGGGFECRDGQLEFRLDENGVVGESDEQLLERMLDIATNHRADGQATAFDDEVLSQCLTPEDLAALDWLVE